MNRGRRSLMLKAMVTAVKPQAIPAATPAVETLRAGWVAQYRMAAPTADHWARGLPHRPHSIETQERVFRMAQQLAEQGIDSQELFANLEEADRSVATAIGPEAVAMAGSRAIGPLLPLLGRPIAICSDGDGPDLRGFGFDPVAFDGHDPAAYAWARFEFTMRARADNDRQPCSCHPWSSSSTIGLARL